MLYAGTMLLAIAASVVYHLFTRALPPGVHPLITLTITYLTAALLCVAVLPFFPLGTSLPDALRQVNWISFAVGAAVLGIEMGFLLMYRAGWNISIAALVANVAVTLVLLPVGVSVFKERVSLVQMSGIVLCVIGLILINRK